jgi:hypothetical protein
VKEKALRAEGKWEGNTVGHPIHVACPSITSFFLHLLHKNFEFAGFLFVLSFLGVCETHSLFEEEAALVFQLRFPKIKNELRSIFEIAESERKRKVDY